VKRQAYLAALQRATQEQGKQPVYIDESGFTPTAVRPYAYAPKGGQVHARVPGHRWTTTSLIAARFTDGFTAPMLFEGACDRGVFHAWLEQVLSPLLDDRHVVLLDNATFHQGPKTAALIEETGASWLFLPPYAPELNPIEKDFANIKRMRQYRAEASIDDIIKLYN